MRTTLELDDDVLEAAREIAANRGSTAGQVISEHGALSCRADERERRGRPCKRSIACATSDAYLLGLAVRKGDRLATFDRHIPSRAVIGADKDHLQLIPA